MQIKKLSILYILSILVVHFPLHGSKRFCEEEDFNPSKRSRLESNQEGTFTRLPEEITTKMMKIDTCGYRLHPVSHFYRNLFLSCVIPEKVTLFISRKEEFDDIVSYIQKGPLKMTEEFLKNVEGVDIKIKASHTHFSEEVIRFLGRNLPSIKELYLHDKREEDQPEVLSYVPESFPRLASLSYLRPEATRTASLASSLRKFSSVKGLSRLSILIPSLAEWITEENNPLASIAKLTTLERLTLIHDVPDRSFSYLSSLTLLKEIEICCNKEFVGEGLKHLIWLNNLATISIYECKYFRVSKELVRYLEKSASLKELFSEKGSVKFRSNNFIEPI